MVALFRHPLKIITDFCEYFFCFSFSIFTNQPFLSIAISFAGIARLACWEHIASDSSGIVDCILSYWNKVIGGQFHAWKQAGWISAICTRTTPIIETISPILSGEFVWHISFSGASALLFDILYVGMHCGITTFGLWMSSMGYTFSGSTLLGILAPIELAFNPAFFCIIRISFSALVSSLFIFLCPFRMCSAITTNSIIIFLGVAFVSFPFSSVLFLSNPLPVIGAILPFIFAAAIYMFFLGNGIVYFAAYHTLILHAIAIVFIEMKCHRRKILLASKAALEWIGDVKHSVSLSLHHKWLSAGGVIYHSLGATLADVNNYIPILREVQFAREF